MVVVHAEPSTSTAAPHKKSRRKMSKKKTNSSVESQNSHEEDAEMQEQTFAGSSEAAQAAIIEDNGNAEDDDIMIDDDPSSLPTQNAAPAFPALPASAQRTTLKSETRRIPIPPHRMTPLKKEWVNVFGPLTEILGLQVRMNVQRKCVEIRVRIVFQIKRIPLFSTMFAIFRHQSIPRKSVLYKREQTSSSRLHLVLMSTYVTINPDLLTASLISLRSGCDRFAAAR